jgi:RimJ/RimL family protein N-acetyltransferase
MMLNVNTQILAWQGANLPGRGAEIGLRPSSERMKTRKTMIKIKDTTMQIEVIHFQMQYTGVYHHCFTDPHWSQWYPILRHVRHYKDAGSYMAGLESDDLTKLIVLLDGQPVGFCHLLTHDEGTGIYEIAGGIIPTYIGRGVGTLALTAIVKFVFNELKANRVFGYVRVDNEPSRALMTKVGFTLEGILREHSITEESQQLIDICIYGYLRSDAGV